MCTTLSIFEGNDDIAKAKQTMFLLLLWRFIALAYLTASLVVIAWQRQIPGNCYICRA
jgi:hypothetical protein